MGSSTVRVRYQASRDSIVINVSSPHRMFRLVPARIGDRTIAILQFNSAAIVGHPVEAASMTIMQPTVVSPSMELAKPIAGLDIPALRGPSYPILTLAQVREENPKANILFDKKDPPGDDNGVSGTYLYPTNVNFIPGILDLTRATIRYDDRNVYFSLHFKALSNPGWHPEYGFQLTFAAIAIHRGESHNTTSIGLNSQYEVTGPFAYDRLIAVGGGFRVTDETGAILCEYLPRPEDAANPIGNVPRRSVEFSIPVEYLGTPHNGWNITILTGAQDDHGGAGIGEFRSVDAVRGEWVGGGKKNPVLPNVYDFMQLKH
jgi:hypothetical protein